MISAMRLHVPLHQVDRRTAWLRVTLLAACFFGLICCPRLWLNARSFPLLPIASWFPVLPPPWDKGIFVMMLLTLVAALWFYRGAVVLFLTLGLFVFCEDQNRGQPWFYMYGVMLALTLFAWPVSLAACRLALSAAYLWSGIQKCNTGFFQTIPAWFVAPAADHWHLSAGWVELLRGTIATAPFLEIGIGIGFWLPRLRRTAMGAVVVLHLMALLFLGPLGYNYDQVIWPWNLAMIALTFVLFTTDEFWEKRRGHPPARFRRAAKDPLAIPTNTGIQTTFAELRGSRAAVLVVALFSLLPALSFAGWWDSYFSFSLYSGNLANPNIFVTQAFADRLPSRLRAHVQPVRTDYDPAHQGPFLVNCNTWAYEELQVPPLPEPRNYRSIYAFLRAYSREPGDLRMIVDPRAGPIVFYQGDSHEFLRRKP